MAPATFSYAQITFGLKGGLVITDIYSFERKEKGFGSSDYLIKGPLNSEVKPKISYNFGALLNAKLHERISGQIELLYSDKGYKYEGNRPNQFNEHTTHFHYLNLSVLLHFHVNPKLKIEYGLEPGYLIATTISYGDRGNQFSVKNSGNRFYMGNFIGLSYQLLDHFELSTRYCQELPVDSSEKLSMQRGLQFTLSYYFRRN